MNGLRNTYHYIGPETARLRHSGARKNPSWDVSSK